MDKILHHCETIQYFQKIIQGILRWYENEFVNPQYGFGGRVTPTQPAGGTSSQHATGGVGGDVPTATQSCGALGAAEALPFGANGAKGAAAATRMSLRKST